ncbi:MAG: hypothetical protein KAQ96_13395, partial [Thermoplasmata archaeon]|nr:hypothetical protein [Thermoplasmata archaeon]
MHNLAKILWIGLALCGLMFVGTVAAEVDWTDSVTDPLDDVEDTEGTVVDMPGADIVSVSISENGEDLNISMMLDGEYVSSGLYSVSVEVDDGDSWFFTRMFFVGFSASDPDMNSVLVEGYYSSDGKILSWVIAKVDLPATEKVEIEYASSTIVDVSGGPTVMDYAGIPIGGDAPVPGALEVVMNFPKLHQMQMKVTMVYKDEDAKFFRLFMDENSDGTISDAEVDSFQEEMESDDEIDPSEANVTYDGNDPSDLTSTYSVEGAKGSVDSTASMKIIVTMKLTFPEPADEDTHVIEFTENPFGEDFVGGDEPWDNEFDMTFTFQAPDGWTFKSGSLPSKMKDYMNDDGDEVSMNQADIQEDWNNTFANLQKFTIEKGDEGPGFGLSLALGATLL